MSKCNNCGDSIRSTRKFCSKSCAARFNNKLRGPRSTKTKLLISESIKRWRSQHVEETTTRDNKFYKNRQINKPTIELTIQCKICGKQFERQKTKGNGSYSRRQTCSRECATIASIHTRPYQNGSRKPHWYFNLTQQKNVLLDSSWELCIAKYLDSLNIIWTRPNPLKWIDENNVDRLYFPDFYLEDYNVYLDPKNPYCMIRDKHKIQYISTRYNLIVGDVEYIIHYINSVKLNSVHS